MATIGNTYPTLVEVTKRMDPNGSVANIAEVMSLYNPVLQDMAWVEGNLPTGHRYTSRNALPAPTWRRYNQGVDSTKSQTEQFDETVGMLEAFSKVDKDLAMLNGNTAAFRYSEDKGFIEAMSQEVATGLFYHSTATSPERFTGLTPRFPSTTATNGGAQVVLAEADDTGTDYTSIWLIGWGPETVFGIYPKGSMAGLQSQDLGEQLVLDANSRQFLAYVTRWQWKCGLCVKDFRYVSRIANIDTGSWSDSPTTGPDLALLMMDAKGKLFSENGVRPAYYMHRDTYTKLQKQLVARQANWLEMLKVGDTYIPSFQGIPVRFVDAITKTEDGIA